MTCPNCGMDNTLVYDSRQRGGERRRNYRCQECGVRFKTVERVSDLTTKEPEPCCLNCANRKRLEKLDYTDDGCKHTNMRGFACIAFSNEGEIDWMIGTNHGMCERWIEKK